MEFVLLTTQIFFPVALLLIAAFHLKCFFYLITLCFQCADDQDAVCTRSVTLSLPILEDMTVKLKHGGVVSVNSMDIQTPMHHGRPLHIPSKHIIQGSQNWKYFVMFEFF